MKEAKSPSSASAVWARRWLKPVASRASTMSQCKLSSIQLRGGGLKAIRRAAKQLEVHLVRLTDDRGNEVVAASTKPL